MTCLKSSEAASSRSFLRKPESIKINELDTGFRRCDGLFSVTCVSLVALARLRTARRHGQRVGARLEGAYHAGGHRHDQNLDDRDQEQRARLAIEREVDVAAILGQGCKTPSNFETPEGAIPGYDGDAARTIEFGSRAEAMRHQAQRQALLGFVGVFVTFDDLRCADQGQKLGIAFDIGNDIEQPFR